MANRENNKKPGRPTTRGATKAKKKKPEHIPLLIPEELHDIIQPYERLPPGNIYSLLLLNIGPPRRFINAADVATLAAQYIEWCTINYLPAQHWVGKEGTEVERKLMRVPNIYGFATFCGTSSGYLFELLSPIRPKNTPENEVAISEAFRRVYDSFKTYLIEAGASGLANPMIIARLTNLTESVKVESQTDANAAPPAFTINITPPSDEH
jgi:hypothetical protein